MEIRNEAIRTQLLEYAIRHFSEKGYAATNLMEIASEAGVTRGPLYYYFSNKADLYQAAVRHVIATQKEAYAQILVPDKPVMDVVREDYLFCLDDKGLLQNIGTGGKDEPDMSAEYNEFTQWLLDKKYLVFQAAKDRGELLPDCDLSELITFIYVYVCGVTRLKGVSGNAVGYNQAILNNNADFFLDIIRSKFIAPEYREIIPIQKGETLQPQCLAFLFAYSWFSIDRPISTYYPQIPSATILIRFFDVGSPFSSIT